MPSHIPSSPARIPRHRGAERPLARDLPADRRELSRDRRAGRLAQSLAHPADDALAGLGAQRHGGPRGAGPDLRAAYQRRPPADRTRPALLRRRDARDRRRLGRGAGQDRGADAGGRRGPHARDGARRSLEPPVRRLARAPASSLTSKSNARLKHIEFVRLDPARALVVLVSEDGSVENRLLDLPPGLPAGALIGGRQLPQRPHPRQDARRPARRDRDPAQRHGARARRPHREARRGRARHDGRHRPRRASSSCAVRRTSWRI